MPAKRTIKRKKKVSAVRTLGQNMKRIKLPPRWFRAKNCTPEDACKYLEDVNRWLDWFWKDYKNLRIAMCNVERKAWSESGATLTRRFCASGGGNDEPADPPKPPVWT